MTQGGGAFILRKAIFHEEEFWGFVAVVIDEGTLLDKINFQTAIFSDHKYKFTASVNGLDTVVIDGWRIG